MANIFKPVLRAVKSARRWLLAITRPSSITAAAATILDLTRSKPTLVAEYVRYHNECRPSDDTGLRIYGSQMS